MAKYFIDTIMKNGCIMKSRYTANSYAHAVSILRNMPENNVVQADVGGGNMATETWLRQSSGLWLDIDSKRAI